MADLDPKFETRAELEAWAKEAEARAVYMWGDKALLGAMHSYSDTAAPSSAASPWRTRI